MNRILAIAAVALALCLPCAAHADWDMRSPTAKLLCLPEGKTLLRIFDVAEADIKGNNPADRNVLVNEMHARFERC